MVAKRAKGSSLERSEGRGSLGKSDNHASRCEAILLLLGPLIHAGRLAVNQGSRPALQKPRLSTRSPALTERSSSTRDHVLVDIRISASVVEVQAHGSLTDQKDYQRRRLVDWLTAELTRATGRRCRIQFETLDEESLREFQHLLRDLDHDRQTALQQRRLQPWRER